MLFITGKRHGYNMERVYSKIDPSLLLHIIVRVGDFKGKSFFPVTEIDSFLQSIGLCLNEGHTAIPHKHIEAVVNYDKRQQQEAWVVLNGTIMCYLYDTDDTLLCSKILQEKCCLITLYGGHSLSVLEDNTYILEFKCGPYKGQLNDKIFINK